MTPHTSRWALYIKNLGGGGAERVMVELANGFAERGCAVDLVLVRAEGIFLDAVSPKVRIIDLASRSAFSSIPKLMRYLREAQPAVLLSTLHHNNLAALLAKRLSGAPTKVAIRVADALSHSTKAFYKKKLEHLLISAIYPWADGIIAVAEDVAKDLANYTGIPREHIQTIYNPVIKPELYEQARQPIDHPWFAASAPPVIVGAGRLTEQKDFQMLIKAFALVRRERPARLLILGEGEQREMLEALVKRLGLEEDVSLPGFDENPFRSLSRAAVFVLSSIWEGLPGVLIQAMACSCPVISTDCPGGSREILKGGTYGYLTPVGDEQAMADAILKVLNGEAREIDQEWLEKFTVENAVQQYHAMLDSMLSSN